MRRYHLIPFLLLPLLCLLLASCGGTNPVANTIVPKAAAVAGDVATQVQTDIFAISKTVVPDLQRAMDVANAPVTMADGTKGVADPHGAACYAGLIIVHQNVNSILAASAAAKTDTSATGVITQAEVMTIFAPESPAFQDAKSRIFQSCFPKFQDAQTAIGAVTNPAALFAALPTLAPVLAPALVGG